MSTDQTNVQLIYQQIEPFITELIGTRQFSSDMILPLISQLIRIIETFSNTQVPVLSGPTKQQIALNVLTTIITQLATSGKITANLSDVLISALSLFGPALIDFAAAAVKKVFDVADDIEDNGCKGCFTRNFKSK